VISALIWIQLFLLRQRSGHWREAVLAASLLWGAALAAIVEGLSLVKALNRPMLIASWLLVAVGVYAIQRRCPRVQTIAQHTRPLPSYAIVLLVGVGAIGLGTGIAALVAAPNTWDSMTYHLPRVMHWQQQQSVAHYPTANLRQLYQAPWSGYAVLNFQILSGGDRFANLVQWLSSIGSLLGVTLIARELGATRFGQIFAAVFAATLPMGILQASSTQNDYVCAFWLVCLSYFVLRAMHDSLTRSRALFIGLSLGLTVFTKGTGYIFVVPWGVLLLFACWRSLLARPGLLLAVAGLPLALNAGFYARNWQLFGTPLATGEESYTNEIFTLASFVSNLARNLALHLPIPLLPHAWIGRGIEALHDRLGLASNDPRTTWQGMEFAIAPFSLSENTAPNPLHFYLAIGSVVGLIGAGGRSHFRRYLLAHSCAVLAAFALFALLLKWQIWHSHLQLPLFVLMAPIAGTVLGGDRLRRLTAYLSALLLVSSLLWVGFNESRPLLGPDSIFATPRVEQYFWLRPDLRRDYLAASEQLAARNCSQVGLVLGADDWEYPFWILLDRPQLQHVQVENLSASLPAATFELCAVLKLAAQAEPRLQIEAGVFEQVWVGDGLRSSLIGRLLYLYARRSGEF